MRRDSYLNLRDTQMRKQVAYVTLNTRGWFGWADIGIHAHRLPRP